MKLDFVEFEEANCHSSLFIDYINQKKELEPFYSTFPTDKNFEKLLSERPMSKESRMKLVEVLADQYGALETCDPLEFNLHSISDKNTFTVTTGHQLNIFTGPLYFIYKIATVINTCNHLKTLYPDYNFVPVYWMASEDHDLEEISHFNLFGKEYKWETEQTGPVGRMKPHSLNSIIDQLPEKVALFEKAYLNFDNLADSVRYYVNELFGCYGLVVLDADDRRLKSMFAPIIEKEVLEGKSNELVNATSQRLDEAGYKNQAFSRDINFFYLENGSRERIVKEGENYQVLNTDKSFTESEIKTLIKNEPEKFSPNVIMRPVYQEVILPNLAYVGGPAEIAYWLQLKDVFDHHNVFFPALMPRVFSMVVNKALEKKVQKLKLTSLDLFKEPHKIKEQYLQKHADSEYDLYAERGELGEVFDKVKKKAEDIDSTLVGFIAAESTKALKSIENISKRLKKAEEQNNETAMKQIDTIKEKLFPGGGLQERHDNFLNFYLNNPGFIELILHKFEPFNYQFHVLHDE